MIVAKSILFCFYCLTFGLLVSGILCFVSILKLSEEAGIQFLGSDFIAIWKVRFGSIIFALFISILLKDNSSSFEQLFDPTNKEQQVFFLNLL
jgi:hypothetical protein